MDRQEIEQGFDEAIRRRDALNPKRINELVDAVMDSY